MATRKRRHRKYLDASRRQLASLSLIGLFMLQSVCLAVFAADPGGAPFKGGLLEALWMQRRPGLAIAIIGVVGVGPLLSLILWRLGGWRRWVMLAMWIAFIVMLDAVAAEKLGSVGRVLWFWKVQPMLGQ